jgi:glycosyltransferase involved in cell wall biosynthesis
LPRLLKAYTTSGICEDVRLVMTGTPSVAMRLEIEALHLGKYVHFVGTKDNEDLASLYRGALALAFPSLYEGFGLPPLEAMSCGTPVVSSNVCSLPEVVGDAGILVDPLDVEAMAGSMRALAESSQLRADLRKKGLLRSQEFTWKKTACKTEEVLRLALSVS